MLKTLCYSIITPMFLSITYWLFMLSRSPASITISSNVEFPVTISRDEFGIPHIKAESISDALYGLGYSMCQDRRWQLDMITRLSTGRLSENFGRASIEVDKFFRNIELKKSAENDIKALPPFTKQVTEKFVQGINDAAAAEWLPIEYYLTWTKWTNMTIVDVQTRIYFMSIFLSTAWGTDALKSELRKKSGKNIEKLIPKDDTMVNPQHPAIYNSEIDEELKGPPEQLLESDFEELLEFYTEIFDLGTGSNSWVISGKHTVSGKPILSSDPHLSPSVPGMWYLNHITVGGETKYGANIIGLPISSIGRTNHVAWGSTNLKADNIDLYAEKSVNSTHYLFGDKTLRYSEFEETIYIKNEQPLKITFKKSIHGPILENSLVGLRTVTPNFGTLSTKNLAFCWASIGQEDKSLITAHNWVDIRTFSDFKIYTKYMFSIHCTSTFASVNGDIGFITVGKVPIRQYKGDRVLPGWKPETMWKGFIPSEKMPYSLNPEKGFIVTANGYPIGNQYLHYESLGSYFVQARAERITEILQSKIDKGHKFNLLEQMEILKDELDIYARKSVPILLKYVKSNTKYPAELKEIKNWDYVMGMDSTPAVVYSKWVIQFTRNLLQGKVEEKLIQYFLRTQVVHDVVHYYIQDIQNTPELCDNPKTDTVENCEDLITKSFEEAVELTGGKKWGEVHKLTLKHSPFSQSNALKGFFERSVYIGGNAHTVHASFYDWNSTFEVNLSAGMILLCDMTGESYWSLDNGISGNVLSSHYSDQFDRFYQGKLINFKV